MKSRNPRPTELWKRLARNRTGQRAAVLVLILGIWLAAVAIRSVAYHQFYAPEAPFFLESAQHFRNVDLVASGRGIPRVDVDLEHPDGLMTRSHTILGETLVGWTWRLLPWEGAQQFARTHAVFGVYLSDLLRPVLPRRETWGDDPLHSFVRQSVRYSMAFLVVPIYLAVSFLARRRLAGFVAAALYAVAYAAVERATGYEFFHEHTAFPFLGFHLFFTVRALRTGKWADGLGSFLFLWIALLCWKVVQFYFLTLIAFFALAFLLGPSDRRQQRLLLVYSIGFVLVALLLETHLRYNRFWFSKPLLVSYAILATVYLLRRLKRQGHAWRVGIFAGLLGVFWLLTAALGHWLPADSLLNPAADRYGHVWETFFAILRYGTKPADPALLSFDARHYWGAPNTPPSLLRFLSLYGLLLPFAAVVFARVALAWRRREEEPLLAEPALWLLLFLFAAFFGFYLLFYKMTSFLALFTAMVLGLGVVLFRGRPARGVYAGLIACLIGLSAVQSLAPRAFPLTQWYLQRGLSTSEEKDYQSVVRPDCMEGLLGWIEAKTDPKAVFLSEFILGPTLLVYADRPINQNPFFESAMRNKYRRFAEGLFESEEDFYALCREWESDYVIYNAHILLRTDPYMSYRYVADEMGWSEGWVAYRFHFRPEELKHFALVYQNDCFRVFRVLPPGEQRQELPDRPPSVFDEDYFAATVKRDAGGRPQTGDWFRRVMWGR